MLPRIIRQSLSTSSYLRNISSSTTSFAPNYAFHNSFPDNSGKEVSYKTIAKADDETQVVKVSQIIDHPTTTTTASISKLKSPKPRNIISIADYFSGNSHHLHHVFYSNLIHAKTKKGSQS